MKKNRTVVTAFLVIITFVLLGTILYISSLLSSSSSPTQIQKTKASAITYTRKVDLFSTETTEEPTPAASPTTSSTNPTLVPTSIPTIPPPKSTPKLIAQAPTSAPTTVPSIVKPSPTDIPEPTVPVATPTLQPLLAYKNTSITPTLIPLANTGGMVNPIKTPSPTKKVQPTGMQQLPESGWIQTSSILFIVATSTILFSLLF